MLVLLLFSALSIAIGVLWDRKTFQWLRQLKVDEMSPFEVSQRIVTLYRWTRCEVVAVAVWAVLFIMLDYWVMDFYLRPLAGQVAFFVVALLFMGLLVGIAYWRLVYRHLDDIKKNMLKDSSGATCIGLDELGEILYTMLRKDYIVTGNNSYNSKSH